MGKVLKSKISRSYDDIGNLLTTAYSSGYSTKNTYNEDGFLSSSEDNMLGFHVSINYEYDDSGKLLKQTFLNGKSIEYNYDDKDRLKLKISKAWTDEYAYDENNRVILITRVADGIPDTSGTIQFNYDINGNLSSRLNLNGDFDEWFYDKKGNVIRHKNSSYREDFIYNDAGILVSSVNLDQGSKVYTFNDAGLMLSYVDSKGYTKEYEYDEIGNCVEECLYKIDEDEHSLELFDVFVK